MGIEHRKTEELFELISKAVSPFHTVAYACDILEKEGFTKLEFHEKWELKKGGAYYLKLYDTSLFAFRIGRDLDEHMILRMAVAHTDFPAFRIKPSPEMQTNGYQKLNTEVYGGMVLNSWFDRPLSMAGKVTLKSGEIFSPKEVLIDFERPMMVIPGLAIHLNRDINKGVEWNKQKDILPIIGMEEEPEESFFHQLIAKELGVCAGDILDFDLYTYNLDKPCCVGMNRELILSPRLDDLVSVHALLHGLKGEVYGGDIHLVAFYDHEEVGSESKQGAATNFTNVLLEKIFESLGYDRIKLYEVLMDSLLVSLDVAHGFHPNFPEKYDPTNLAKLNHGVVIKVDTRQKYAYDTVSVAVIQQICEEHNISYQKFANRSDATCGNTMGPIVSALLPVRAIDLGIPLLSMHSAAETIGEKDQQSMLELMQAFFSIRR